MPESVDAPGAAARRREVEENKAIQDGEFASVSSACHGKESLGRVRDEIGKRHLARKDERRGASEEAEGQQDAADKLKNAGEAY